MNETNPLMDPTDFQLPSLEELYNTYTSEELAKEATRFGTIQTGTYDVQITEAELRPNQADADYAAKDDTTPENRARVARPRFHLTINLSDNGAKKGTIFADASHVVMRTKGGQLDAQSALFGQLENGVTAKGEKLSVPEVIKAAKTYVWKGKVEEVFILDGAEDPKQRFKTATTPEQRAQYTTEGRQPINRLRRVWLPKG